MHVHKLIREKDSSRAEWLLEWDESVFRLSLPDGRSILEAPSKEAHRLIEMKQHLEAAGVFTRDSRALASIRG